MKKIICVLFLCAFMCFCLVGCSIPQGIESSKEGSTTKIYNNDIYEFIDPDTGVHYWIYSYCSGYAGMGGMTPRLNSDGTVMITK